MRAAIIDALIKKHDLKGTTLYATLIPDHIDSQFIREVGITKVVFVEDKFSKFAFTIASKRILNGLEWRYIIRNNYYNTRVCCIRRAIKNLI